LLMRILHKLLAFITILICLVSCSPLTPVAVTQASSFVATPSTVKPLSPRPPEASLEINGKTQQAGIGSYCWSNGSAIIMQNLCARAIASKLGSVKEVIVLSYL
ncbi:MAG: hypothetical protein WCK35_29320, partial [Chloroflexota bacterium]